MSSSYQSFHEQRFELTLSALNALGSRKLIEVGAHPWNMTRELINAGFEIGATVSAEELTCWPDDIPVRRRMVRLSTDDGEHEFPNYEANIERTLLNIDYVPDTVIACEIIEHLIRAPHVMLLNINQWLPKNGILLLTTPNGEQFQNPVRLGSRFNAYRAHVYERHNYAFSLDDLVELVELSGFSIEHAGYWNTYPRSGLAKAYALMRRIPGRYFTRKFSQTCVILARKKEQMTSLARTPKCYSPSSAWEMIDKSDGASSE